MSSETQNRQPEKRAAKTEAKKAVATNSTGRAKANPVAADATYGNLSTENRVVMRHEIAQNIENFRASTDSFDARPVRTFPPLQTEQAPFISIVVPNYNGEALLPDLFLALEKQTFGDFELIFVDDASRDGSVKWVEERYADSDTLSVRVLVNRRNIGFVASCNMAADAARGRVLVLLNSDTEPEPEWLAELARAVCENPQAAIVTSKILLFNERTKLHTTGDMMGADGIPLNRGVWEEDRGQYDQQRTVFGGNGGGTAYRKDVWQMLGGFDSDFWMYLEDVDLAFRAQLAGWEAVFAPDARLYHHVSATSGHTLASYYVGRNTIWNVAKNMPRSLLVRNLPAIIQAQLQVTVDALRNWRGEAARARLLGQAAGIIGLVRQLRKRSVIQPRRILEDEELRRRLR